jgi:hypothetical protein
MIASELPRTGRATATPNIAAREEDEHVAGVTPEIDGLLRVLVRVARRIASDTTATTSAENRTGDALLASHDRAR